MIPGQRTLRALLNDSVQPFLDDPATTEVVVNKPGEIGVESRGQWTWHECPSLTYDRLDAIGVLAAAMTSRDVDSTQPLCTTTLPDGGERMQVCMPPATTPGVISLTIRKPATFARRVEDPDFPALFEAKHKRRSDVDDELIALKKAGDWPGFWRLARNSRKTIGITGRTGSGKAQPYNSKVLTPSGFKPIGEIRVGDTVLTPSGATSRVTGLFPQGEKDIYRVTFRDGRTVECCDDHLWKVWDWSSQHETGKSHATRKVISGARWTVAPLRDIRKWGQKAKRAAVPLVDQCSVEFPPSDLPIDPYALGALIGDGCFGSNPSVRIATIDPFILERVGDGLPDYKIEYRGEGNRVDYRVLMKEKRRVSPLRCALDALGLLGCRSHEKFIPSAYKTGSVSQRLALVQGLMDTDGSVGNGTHATFSSTSERLVNDLQEILWSLGAIASISKRQTYYTYKGKRLAGKPSWRMSIVMQDVSCLFSLPRKIAACKSKGMRHRLRIMSIDYARRDEAVCISIDHPDHLYVTDGYVVTHNTDVAKRLMQITPPHLRIVTIEDNPETRGLGPRNTVNLFYGDSRANLTAEAVLTAALRMRPDEIHLSEVRGAEAFAFLRAVGAGHPGSITTWHAEEGKEIAALVAMVKQHEAGRALDDVEERIRTFVDIIVWCDRTDQGFIAPRVWLKAEGTA